MSQKWFFELVLIVAALVLSRLLLSVKARQAVLLSASYGFYLSFGKWFLAVLIASSLMNYAFGMGLRRHRTAALLWTGVLANVALLSFFKYLPPLAETLNATSGIGELSHIAMPIGISFWTFQALSYLFDVWREQELDPSLPEFCLYMAFAPTVLSGPICRVRDQLKQFREGGNATGSDLRCGLQRIWLGFFMVAVAGLLNSGLRPETGIESGFQLSTKLHAVDVWALAIAYGFHLFFDFAGYTHIAIGTARLFGFRLQENFDRPFFSTTPSEFWTRWHMSLSMWIRDYVFMPLATVRPQLWWRYVALVISMVIFGIWHKATLLFLIWGVYQGGLLVAHRMCQKARRRFNLDIGKPACWLLTFGAMSFGWIFFRASDLPQGLGLAKVALLPTLAGAPALLGHFYIMLALVVLGYVVLERTFSWENTDSPPFARLPLELRLACYSAMVYLVFLRAAHPQGFIYTQF